MKPPFPWFFLGIPSKNNLYNSNSDSPVDLFLLIETIIILFFVEIILFILYAIIFNKENLWDKPIILKRKERIITAFLPSYANVSSTIFYFLILIPTVLIFAFCTWEITVSVLLFFFEPFHVTPPKEFLITLLIISEGVACLIILDPFEKGIVDPINSPKNKKILNISDIQRKRINIITLFGFCIGWIIGFELYYIPFNFITTTTIIILILVLYYVLFRFLKEKQGEKLFYHWIGISSFFLGNSILFFNYIFYFSISDFFFFIFFIIFSWISLRNFQKSIFKYLLDQIKISSI